MEEGRNPVWFDDEQWLSREKSAELWRDLTGTPMSGKTWGRMATAGRLAEMGIRTQDDGRYSHKLDILNHLAARLEASLQRVQAERESELQAMKARGEEQ